MFNYGYRIISNNLLFINVIHKNYLFTKCINKIAFLTTKNINSKQIHTSSIYYTFWERDKKSGYGGKIKLPSRKQLILDGLKELKSEIALWQQEMKEKFQMDPILLYRPGEIDCVWKFRTKDDLDNWIVTTDSDHLEGYSRANFEISNYGYGLFHGNVNSQIVRDGKLKRTGYANIRCLRARKSFKRDSTFDWSQYNTLVIKLRGDGRSYLLNLHCEGYFDILWNDVYHYALYTRGGPHWQITKIPFSKFFLASKGRVQDRQGPIPLNRITHFGLSVSAKGGCDGQFSLEIDYIGLEYDPSHREEFAYEMYKQQKYIVAT